MSESQIPMRSAGLATRAMANEIILPADAAARAPGDSALWPSLLSGLQKIFSFPMMLATFLVGGVAASVRLFDVDPDLWWHVKVGESILATHQFPTTDPYSFTVHGQPWLAYEWLGGVILAGAQRAGGVRGLDALLIALSAAVILAIYALTTLRTGNSKAGAAATALLLILARPSFSLRPQMFGYLFLVLTLIALESFRQGKRRVLWCLPLVMLLWVNTHGSWIIGMGTIFVYWMSGLFEFRVGGIETERWSPEDRKQISFVFLLCLCALPLTPYGTQLAMSPFEFASSLPLNVTKIMEWQPMPFDLAGGKVFLGLFLAFVLAQIALQYKWKLAELAFFLFGTVMACLHIRFLLIFVPFFAPILAVMIARWMNGYDRSKDRFVLNAVLMAGVVAGIVHYFPSRDQLQEGVSEHWPVAAVEYLDTHQVPGPMYNTYGFGGYLVWARGPGHKVFIDGRGDVYERGGVFNDYLHIAHIQPGALAVLRNYRIQSCLVERNEALGTLLSASPDWKKVYSDNVAALYVRNGGL
ncbi:MAG: hypothetical protein WB987_09190 [Candidatus Acidiferrales bacterium]